MARKVFCVPCIVVLPNIVNMNWVSNACMILCTVLCALPYGVVPHLLRRMHHISFYAFDIWVKFLLALHCGPASHGVHTMGAE